MSTGAAKPVEDTTGSGIFLLQELAFKLTCWIGSSLHLAETVIASHDIEAKRISRAQQLKQWREVVHRVRGANELQGSIHQLAFLGLMINKRFVVNVAFVHFFTSFPLADARSLVTASIKALRRS